MPTFNDLAQLTGAWTGHNSLWFEPGAPVFESATSAAITLVAGGKVLTMDYAWTHDGQAQDGRILISIDASEGVHMAWCDSFHMGTKLLDLVAGPGAEVIAATGSYRVDESEPWGWRIELSPQSADAFQLRMFNLLPVSLGGIEALAVQADYIRA